MSSRMIPVLLAALCLAQSSALGRPTRARSRPSRASPELRQLLSLAGTPSADPLLIVPLKSRYPIWAVRLRGPADLLRYLGSEVLWLDLRKTAATGPLGPADDVDGDGSIDGRDIAAALGRELGAKGISAPAAEYDAEQLAAVANRYARDVPGKTVSMPPSEAELLERLSGAGVIERTALGYSAPREAALIFLTPRCAETQLDHELVHALYAVAPGFRERVALLWQGLAPAERDGIKAALGKVYAVQHEDLLLSEFAAHATEEAGGFLFGGRKPPAARRKEIFEAVRRARDEFLAPDGPGEKPAGAPGPADDRARPALED